LIAINLCAAFLFGYYQINDALKELSNDEEIGNDDENGNDDEENGIDEELCELSDKEENSNDDADNNRKKNVDNTDSEHVSRVQVDMNEYYMTDIRD